MAKRIIPRMLKPTKSPWNRRYRKGDGGTKECAEWLGTTQATLMNTLKRRHGRPDEMPFWTHGGRYQFDKQEIEDWAVLNWRTHEKSRARNAMQPTNDADVTVGDIPMTAVRRSNLSALCASTGKEAAELLGQFLDAPPHTLLAAWKKAMANEGHEFTIPKEVYEYLNKIAEAQGRPLQTLLDNAIRKEFPDTYGLWNL